MDGQVVRPGIVTSSYDATTLVFESCVFRDNNYGDPHVQVILNVRSVFALFNYFSKFV